MRPSTSVWQRPAARATRVAVGAFLATASLVAAPGLGLSSASATGAPCGPGGTLYANGTQGELVSYAVSGGTVATGTPIGNSVGASFADLAFAKDGNLYGVATDNQGSSVTRIDLVNGPQTPTTLTFGSAPAGALEGLTGLPDGTLLASAQGSNKLYVINPVTGATTESSTTLPDGTTSAGDLVAVAGGDVLALVTQGADTALARIHPGSATPGVVLGTVEPSVGATLVDSKLYLSGADGQLRRLDSIPTSAGTSALATTVVDGAASFPDAGLASDQEALACAPASLDVVPTKGSAGGSVPVAGGGWPASSDVSFGFTDPTSAAVGTAVVVKSDANGNLPAGSAVTLPADAKAGVLTVTATGGGRTATDSLEVVAVAVDAPETTVSGSKIDLTSTGFVAAQPVTVTLKDSGGTVTTTTVTPAADGKLTAVQVPATAKTGAMGVTATQGSLTATDTTTVEAAAAGLTLTVEPGVVTDVNTSGTTDVGDTIDYTFTVTGSGNVPVTGVTVQADSLSADPITCTPSDVPPQGTATCGPATHTVTEEDATAGLVTVGATASGTGPDGAVVTTAEMVSGATTIEPPASVPEESVPGDPTEVTPNSSGATPTDTGTTETTDGTTTATTTAPTETTTTSTGTLPNTGGLAWYWAVLGAASFGAGAVLVRPTRRRRPPAGMI